MQVQLQALGVKHYTMVDEATKEIKKGAKLIIAGEFDTTNNYTGLDVMSTEFPYEELEPMLTHMYPCIVQADQKFSKVKKNGSKEEVLSITISKLKYIGPLALLPVKA